MFRSIIPCCFGVCIVFACMSLVGCASSVRVSLPNGAQGYNVDCSTDMSDWNECYLKASELCPSGYTVVQKQSSPNAVGENMDRDLMIQCN